MVEPLFCNIEDKSTIYRYVSEFFQVCTYFLICKEKVIIVDPGKLNKEVYSWLLQFKNLDKIIYITHEHFDHHFDVNYLLSFPKTTIYLPTKEFEEALKNSRKNLSYYNSNPIETNCCQISVVNYLEIIATPGHSEFSYCYIYKNILFGGDTLIEKKYIVLKLPGSNKKKYEESILKLKNKIEPNFIVMPGHGEYFCFNKWLI